MIFAGSFSTAVNKVGGAGLAWVKQGQEDTYIQPQPLPSLLAGKSYLLAPGILWGQWRQQKGEAESSGDKRQQHGALGINLPQAECSELSKVAGSAPPAHAKQWVGADDYHLPLKSMVSYTPAQFSITVAIFRAFCPYQGQIAHMKKANKLMSYLELLNAG